MEFKGSVRHWGLTPLGIATDNHRKWRHGRQARKYLYLDLELQQIGLALKFPRQISAFSTKI